MLDNQLTKSVLALKNCKDKDPALYEHYLKVLLFFAKEVKKINNSILENVKNFGNDYTKIFDGEAEALNYFLQYNIFVAEGLEDLIINTMTPDIANNPSNTKITDLPSNLN